MTNIWNVIKQDLVSVCRVYLVLVSGNMYCVRNCYGYFSLFCSPEFCGMKDNYWCHQVMINPRLQLQSIYSHTESSSIKCPTYWSLSFLCHCSVFRLCATMSISFAYTHNTLSPYWYTASKLIEFMEYPLYYMYLYHVLLLNHVIRSSTLEITPH